MGSALSIFVLLSISVFIIRVASVALRLTGLAESSARFQAISAFTGTGFTTSEAETIVNYPIRRQIISLLMVIGNIGLVSILATLVVSLVNTDGEIYALMTQLAWLLGGLILLWVFMLNAIADHVLCKLIGWFLKSTTFLGKRRFQRLLQVGNGYSVCEHPVVGQKLNQEGALAPCDLQQMGLTVLAVRTSSGAVASNFSSSVTLEPGDKLVLYGRDEGHEALERFCL